MTTNIESTVRIDRIEVAAQTLRVTENVGRRLHELTVIHGANAPIFEAIGEEGYALLTGTLREIASVYRHLGAKCEASLYQRLRARQEKGTKVRPTFAEALLYARDLYRVGVQVSAGLTDARLKEAQERAYSRSEGKAKATQAVAPTAKAKAAPKDPCGFPTKNGGTCKAGRVKGEATCVFHRKGAALAAEVLEATA